VPVSRVMFRSSVSVVLGVVMTIPVPNRNQRGMAYICEHKSIEQAARRQE
jgi:hypothetical protein